MLEKGSVLNQTYCLIEQIGSGGGGIVYKAYHKRLRKYVVVKEIRDCVKGILESRAEVDILKNLAHTYLPQVYDFLEIDGGIYTVIDFIDGESMDKALQREGFFSQKEVLKWAKQLAEALAYLHSQNPPVIHSDIKPANIMLTPERDICLIDFNVSLAFDAGMRTSTGVSKGYSPPEQYWSYEMYCSMVGIDKEKPKQSREQERQTEIFFEEQRGSERALKERQTEIMDVPENAGSGTCEKQEYITERVTQLFSRGIDERSDIYSLGATLYHLLTGTFPTGHFEEITPISQCGVNISEGLALIIEKMMEISPEKRYRNGIELLQAFQNIYELDSVYKKYHRQRKIAGLGLVGLYAVSALLMLSGMTAIQRETAAAYYQEIETAEKFMEEQNFEEAKEHIEAATEILPVRVDAYVKETERLYLMGDYDGCILYGKEMLNNPQYDAKTAEDTQKIGRLFYTVGNAYYENDDFVNANGCFESSLRYDESNSYYYRDYSISLARSGNLEQAEDMLEQAVALGMGQDSVYMVQGELAFARKDYEKAIKLFSDTLHLSEDDTMKERCVLFADRAYRMLEPEDIGREIEFLTAWEKQLGNSKNMKISECLAEAYFRKGDYENALSRFLKLQDQGYVTYQMMSNTAVLYQQMGQLEQAREQLLAMEERYPNRYETYRQLAFLEADIQQRRGNSQRNYRKMKEYYDKAMELYQPLGITDSRMQMLETLVKDAKAGGWLG